MRIVKKPGRAKEPIYIIYLPPDQIKKGAKIRIHENMLSEPMPSYRTALSIVIDSNDETKRWSAHLRKENKIWILKIRYQIVWIPEISKEMAKFANRSNNEI